MKTIFQNLKKYIQETSKHPVDLDDVTIEGFLKDAFIEGYKMKAYSSNLKYDKTSELYAGVLFKKCMNKN